MGMASKVVLVIFRIWQIISSVIVLGILARFLDVLSEAGVTRDGRTIYGIIVASISVVFAIVFIAPFMYAFIAFPFDFALFVMWLVLFCLLITRTGTRACSSPWYWNYWGYYWGGWWRRPAFINGPSDIAHSGCSHWRAVLAFAFQALFAFLVTAILGAFVMSKYWKKNKTGRNSGTTSPMIGHPQTAQVGGLTPTGHPEHTGGMVGNAPGTAPATGPGTAPVTTTPGQAGTYV